jgi:c-di-GMP-binding flagellar brake protein YcgR
VIKGFRNILQGEVKMALSGAVSERRKFVRIDSDFPVQLKYMDSNSPGHVHNSLSQDLSEGGMQISSFYFYPVHSRMLMELYLSMDSEPVKTMGKIVWIEQLPYQDMYKVGIEFSDLNDKGHDSLKELIDDTIN